MAIQGQKKKSQKKQKEKPLPTDSLWKKIWYFLWEEDSFASWVANILIAFILIQFIVYPILGALTGSSMPVVAVVSGSMEHSLAHPCQPSARTADGMCLKSDNSIYTICGTYVEEKQRITFDSFWGLCGEWYGDYNITKETFSSFPLKNGFNTGDVMVVQKKAQEDIYLGDVIVFLSDDGIPIIHRVVQIYEKNGKTYYQTKGDHNSDSIVGGDRDETMTTYEDYQGTAVFRIPFIGYVKIIFVKAFALLGLF